MLGVGLKMWGVGVAGGGAAPWTPEGVTQIIEWNDASTLRTAANAVPAAGETVQTWLSQGSVGDLTMTRQTGTPTAQLSNGQPYMAVPSVASGSRVFSFVTKDIVGTELWTVFRKGSGIKNFFSDGVTGGQVQVKAGANLTVFGSLVNYSPQPLVPVPEATWVIGRAQFRTDGGFMEVNGAGRDVFTGSQTALQVSALGYATGADGSNFDIAVSLTVFGTADAELETNLYAYLGAIRDELNGV